MKKFKSIDQHPTDARLTVIRGDEIFCYFADDQEVIEAEKLRDEDQARLQRNRKKETRNQLVKNITVTTSTGHTFNADETSQQRMARAVAVLHANELISWTLANNVVDFVTREDLAEALRLAVFKQTELWKLPD